MGKIHGVKRVFAFCILTAIIPSVLIIIPLYLRHSVFADVTYEVAESDVIAIQDGVSSIFCESHLLKMNSSFNAFQLKGPPTPSKKLKHIRLKKSMTLPDDTLEYWGFFLPSGAKVKLKVCSRYNGSRILVVRGDKDFKTCDFLKPNYLKHGTKMDHDHSRVRVTFENAAEVIGVIDHPVFDKNTGAEDFSDDTSNLLQDRSLDKRKADVEKFLHSDNLKLHHSVDQNHRIYNLKRNLNVTNTISSHLERHRRRKIFKNLQTLNKLRHFFSDEDSLSEITMQKRDIAPLDAHIKHGGNANNDSIISEENSVSSFESNLMSCYDGTILLTRGFPSTDFCNGIHYLEYATKDLKHMQILHEVASDGYYYYIFYSDNDLYKNDIHTIFDIYKPTYRFAKMSKGNDCINQTECKFPISFLHDETVIVEVPTKNGIEHEENDITLLLSKCHPRMTVYMIFPITALLLILGFAFL